MIIQDINLAGFKHLDEASGLNLTQVKNQSILSARGKNKKFLFESLLGIIYGFNDSERTLYKDPGSFVFTGRVDLRFDDYTLHIERDFETDIVAVLSLGKQSQKPVFQGKDNCSMQTRPYLDILKSFFSINNKSFLLNVCSDKLNAEQPTFGDLLDLLYLFLRPQFKIVAIKKLIEYSNKIISQSQGFVHSNNSSINLQNALNRLQLLKNAKKIFQSISSLESDNKKFKQFWESLKYHYQNENRAAANLKQRFPLIYHMDAHQVKKDITRINALQKNYKTVYQQLQKLNSEKIEIEQLLNKKLLVYSNLPDSFIDDFHRYQELTIDLAQTKNDYDKHTILIGNLQDELSQVKKIELIVQTLSMGILLITGSILFSSKILIVLFVMLLVASVTFVVFRMFKKKNIDQFDKSQQDQVDLKNAIKKYENEIYALREESYLLDDLEYIDVHIERFQKYKQVKVKLAQILIDKNQLQEQLDSEKFQIDLPKLERQYKDIISLKSSENISEYLDEFEKTQQEANDFIPDSTTPAALEPLNKIIREYERLNASLKKTIIYIEDYLEIEQLDQNIDQEIATLERATQHLKQKNQTEKIAVENSGE